MLWALSRGLFGHEQHHQLIRLLTEVEIAEHLEYYDGQHDNYKDLIKDNRLIHDPYQQLLLSVSTHWVVFRSNCDVRCQRSARREDCIHRRRVLDGANLEEDLRTRGQDCDVESITSQLRALGHSARNVFLGFIVNYYLCVLI